MEKIHVINFKYGLSCGIHILSCFDNFHQHNEIEMTFFEKSPVQYRTGNVITEVAENEVLMFWGAIPHQLVKTEPNNVTYFLHIPLPVFFQWDIPDEIFERLLNGQVFTAQNDEPALDKINFILWAKDLRNLNTYIRKAVLLNIEARIFRFIANFTSAFDSMESSKRKIHPDKTSFAKLYAYALKHYRSNKTIKEIAADLNMHPNYVSELFKNNSGHNIVDFLNMLKIAESQKLLLTTKMKIVDIAFEVGFGSLSNFNLVFKKYCDISPTKYREGFFNASM